MKGIILAAGRGSRMGDLTNNQPKCFLKINDQRLIEWQMQALNDAGIGDIAIIRGYLANTFQFPVSYFDNSRWHETNMVFTLLCATEWLEKNDTIISYADIIYAAEIVQKLRDTPGDIVISYDVNWQQLWEKRFTDPLSDAEIFKHDNGWLKDIGGKAESIADIQGQYMGLLKCTPIGWQQIKAFLLTLSQKQIDKLDMTSLLRQMLLKGYKIAVLPTQSPWCEVDSEEDYLICQEIFGKK